MTYITLNQNYGYTPYKVTNLAAHSVIDATNATWIVDNSRNDSPDATHLTTYGTGALNTYPFKVDGAGTGLLIKGGSIWGQVPQQSDWQYTYTNSAAIRVANAPDVIIDDWRLDSTWDAIRIAAGSTNFLIDDTWITNVRDDAVENDYVLGGTIRDSLFDGVFSGISLGDSDHYDGSMNTITLDGLMMRNKSYLFEGKVTHETPFKCDTGAPGTTPDIRIDNSVIAIEDVNHAGQKRLQIAWDHVVESHGNVFLNLSDTPLPSTYPKPPAGFTILQGQQARDYWEACKAAWHANHDGVNDAGVTALPPLPGGGTTSPPTPPPPPPGVVTPGPGPTGDAHSDFNGDGRSDIAWLHSTGAFSSWSGQANGSFVNNGATGANALDASWHIVGIGDFNGDGKDDLLWRNTAGTMGQWQGQSNGTFTNTSGSAANVVDNSWSVAGVADYNGDGRDDVLWRHSSGAVTEWLGQAGGKFVNNSTAAANSVDPSWSVAANGDFDGDGRADVLWHQNSGAMVEWHGSASGALINAGAVMAGATGSVVGAADFNGDGRDDVLTRAADGSITEWMGQTGGQFTAMNPSLQLRDSNWHVGEVGDFNGDGFNDLLWRHSSGTTDEWLGSASGQFSHNGATPTVDLSWHIQSTDTFMV